MPRRGKSLFGSGRASYFREPSRRSSTKQRSQRVKFRRRYAASVARAIGERVWRVAQVVIAGGVITGGGFIAWRAWGQSNALRVTSVSFTGDIPPILAKSFPVQPGQQLLRIKTGVLEKQLAERFPELEDVSVSRRFNRGVVVNAHYRVPVALVERDGKQMGLDAAAVLFPIADHNRPTENLPIIDGKINFYQLVNLVEALREWKETSSEFYSLVKRIETDNMADIRVVLEDGVVVHWGEMRKEERLAQTKNILRLRERFVPVKTPATLRLVTADRIVIDSNWIQKTK